MSKNLILKTAIAVGLVASTVHPGLAETLKVPGAKIYYEVRGSGPLLLMIPGGPADAGVYAAISGHLTDKYTVVTYDPRGNSRSTLDGQPQDQTLDEHGDDAALLIKTISKEPVLVFGSSGGAQIGLNLAARHPELVRMLVAHEPPSIMLLSDPSKELAMNKDVHETYIREGVDAAIKKFMATAGLDDAPPPPPPTPEAAETLTSMNSNMDYFFGHGIIPLTQYMPDVTTLRSGKPKVIIAIGEKSAGQVTYRTGQALAEKLGTKPIIFPGAHMGYTVDTVAFADVLRQTLNKK